jgi:hypothetical protein
LVLVVAWPTELLACHRFHQRSAFSRVRDLGLFGVTVSPDKPGQ